MSVAEVVVGVDVAAPPEQVWAAITDWERQDEWILATRVRSTSTNRAGLGAEIEAVTGIGRFGVRDTMRVTVWEPPWRCTVEHTGRVIRGRGIFEVSERPGGSRFTWTEELDVPFGAVGRAGWPLAAPLVRFGLQRSLKNFAVFAENYDQPDSA